MRILAVALSVLSLLQGCVTVNPYPEDWPALQRERVIHSPPPERPQSATDCPLIAGTYANEGIRFPADAVPLRLTDFFPLRLGDVSQVLSVRIDQTEGTLGITVIRENGTSATTTFTKGNHLGLRAIERLRADEFLCWYDITTKDHGFVFSGLPTHFHHYAGALPGAFILEGGAVAMRTAVDRSLVVTWTEGVGALVLVVPAARLTLRHYRFPAVDAAR
jgi:hypothetical protein